MRIGIDGRMAYYTEAGIGQYIRRLVQGLTWVESPETFVLFQSRKDAAVMANTRRLKRRNLWTPSHHRMEQWVLPIEFAFTNIDLLHSPDFIPRTLGYSDNMVCSTHCLVDLAVVTSGILGEKMGVTQKM